MRNSSGGSARRSRDGDTSWVQVPGSPGHGLVPCQTNYIQYIISKKNLRTCKGVHRGPQIPAAAHNRRLLTQKALTTYLTVFDILNSIESGSEDLPLISSPSHPSLITQKVPQQSRHLWGTSNPCFDKFVLSSTLSPIPPHSFEYLEQIGISTELQPVHHPPEASHAHLPRTQGLIV